MLYLNEKDFRNCKELNCDIINDIVNFINENDMKIIDCGRYDIN